MHSERREIEAVIDTGFTSSLSLPLSLVSLLNLPWLSQDRAVLGDGSVCLFHIHEAVVEWDGTRQTVQVHASESEPLVGMELLHGFELNLKVKQGGKVTIKRLPKR